MQSLITLGIVLVFLIFGFRVMKNPIWVNFFFILLLAVMGSMVNVFMPFDHRTVIIDILIVIYGVVVLLAIDKRWVESKQKKQFMALISSGVLDND
jgi:uncharacterized membrane protein